MELEDKTPIQPEDVIQIELPIGLPPKHYKELYDKYEKYFKGDGKVFQVEYCGKKYHLCMKDVRAFVQDLAAMMTKMDKIGEAP